MVTTADVQAALPELLAEHWLLFDVEVTPVLGGMNSLSFHVTWRGRHYAAKWVPDHEKNGLLRGCQLASRLITASVSTGCPLPSADDRLIVPCAGGWLTLMPWIPGDCMTGASDDEQAAIGRALGLAHAATGNIHPGDSFPDWLRVDGPSLDLEPWIRPEVEAALAAYDALPPLHWVYLHTDPAPDAFILDANSGRISIIDWTGATPGPAMYDIASTVIYLGGRDAARQFIAGYHDTGPVLGGDWQNLDTFIRLRWAVQAAYFAERIVRGDLTGVDELGNRRGLDAARAGLAGARV